jgi:hypothetical protein
MEKTVCFGKICLLFFDIYKVLRVCWELPVASRSRLSLEAFVFEGLGSGFYYASTLYCTEVSAHTAVMIEAESVLKTDSHPTKFPGP